MATDFTVEKKVEPNIVAVDVNQLTDMIAQSVAKAMAALLPQMQGGANLGQTIAQGVVEGISKTERKKMTFGQYLAIGGHSPFHPNTPEYPDGHSHPRLLHKVFQNGAYCFEDTLHDKEIVLLNKITHSGRYCGRLVEVIVNNEGSSDEVVEIRFGNSNANIFQIYGEVGYNKKKHVSPFEAILESIVADQEAENEERQEQEVEVAEKMIARQSRPGQGHMGGSKAYREAVARAEAKEQGVPLEP